jgi:hypothetical protein
MHSDTGHQWCGWPFSIKDLQATPMSGVAFPVEEEVMLREEMDCGRCGHFVNKVTKGGLSKICIVCVSPVGPRIPINFVPAGCVWSYEEQSIES